MRICSLANLELTAYSSARVVHHRTMGNGLATLRACPFDLLFIDLSLRDSTISGTLDQLSLWLRPVRSLF